MAQLKDTVIQGSLRVTDTTITTNAVITNTTAPTIANNDYLLIADASDSNKLVKGPVFDGSTTSQALSKKGTWSSFLTGITATSSGSGNVVTGISATGSTVSFSLGTVSTTGHTHNLSLAADTGTSTATLAHGGKYKLTAGGNSVIFTLPSDNNTTYTIATGDSSGQIKVTPSSGDAYNVTVKNIAAAAYKGVTDNSSNADVTSSDTNLITGRTLYYQLAKKGYTTNTGTVTTVATGSGLTGGPITTSGTISIATGGVSNDMLAGSIANGKLANSAISIAGTSVSLGSSITADTLRTNLGLSNAMHFRGIATVAYSDSTFPAISGYSTKENGDVVIDKDSKYEYVWTGSAWELLGGDESYKTKQSAVSSPTASGNTVSFIDTISQDANGVISATKKTIPTGSTTTAGITKVGASGGAAAYSHDHSQIVTVGDKRSENTTPNSYSNKIIFQGLKTNTAINSPSGTTYSYLIGLRGWSDSSGGDSHEIAFNDNGIYWRHGSTTTWGSWFKLDYTHPTSSGNKHVPSGGSSGQFLGWDSDGTAKWVANPNTNTTYSLSGALSSHKFSSTLTPSTGSATTADITFVAGTNISLSDDTTNRKITIGNTYSLPIAAYNTLGGLKPPYSNTKAATITTTAASVSNDITIAARSTTTNRYYAIEVDKDGVPFVNVPWTNVNSSYLTGVTTTVSGSGNGVTGVTASGGTITVTKGTFLTSHQTYTSFTGKPTGNQTPGFGSTFTIQQISQSTAGQVSGTDRTVTIPSTIAKNDTVGLVKPWYNHTSASTGPTAGSNATAVAVNTITTTSGRYYAIEADSNGRLFVNVPWTNTNSSYLTGITSTSSGSGNAVTSVSASGGTITYTLGSVAPATGSTSITTLGTITTGTWNGTEISGSYLGVMTGATSSTAGSKGAVPAPAAGDQGKVLNGAGNWIDRSPSFKYTTTETKIYLLGTTIIPRSSTQPTSTLYTPGDESDDCMYMDSTTNTLVAPNATFGGSVTATSFSGSGAGLTNIPASAVANMTGATSSEAGAAGIIPAPAAGDQAAFLQGDATWYKLNARNGTGTGAVVEGSPADGANSLPKATGTNSHAEGLWTEATGNYSHAEGYGVIASGYDAHAEGQTTTASGFASHTEGYFTIANHAYQHVFGEYNIGDTSTAAATERGNFIEIVGNGTASNSRSNARTLDWDGNEILSGNCTAVQFYETGSAAAPSGTITGSTAILTTSGWSNKSQTVTVQGVTASNTIVVSSAPTSMDAYSIAGIKCISQSTNSLTFTCNTVPTTNLTVNIIII